MAKGQIKQKQATIKKEMFESLCAIQCTKEEICAVLDVCTDTLDAWCKATYNATFQDIANKKREVGKSSLRRTQWRQSEKNPTMAIWLGKQYLKQRDNVEVESTHLVKVEELLNKIEEEAGK